MGDVLSRNVKISYRTALALTTCVVVGFISVYWLKGNAFFTPDEMTVLTVNHDTQVS